MDENWIHLTIRILVAYGLGMRFVPRLIREYGTHLNGYRSARIQMIVACTGLFIGAIGAVPYFLALMFNAEYAPTLFEIGKWGNTVAYSCVGWGGRLLYRFRGIP